MILLAVIQCTVYGQKHYLEGEKAYKSKAYYKAIIELREALQDAKTPELSHPHILFLIGMSYKQMGKKEEGLPFLEQAVQKGYDDEKAIYALAECYQSVGRYYDAIDTYGHYIEISTENKLSQQRLQSCDYALRNHQSNPYVEIIPEDGINTSGNENNLSFVNNLLIYSSTGEKPENPQKEYKKTNKFDNSIGLYYSQLYALKYQPEPGLMKDGKKIKPKDFSGLVDGTFAFDSDQQKLYFSRFDELTGRSYIYSAILNAKNKLEKLQQISIPLGDASATQPALGMKGKRLYFSSNKEGGYGKNDIWYSDQDDRGNWGEPINMGEGINSAGNEVFPYICGDSLLFFSSDGLPGYGGLDLFVSRIENDSLFLSAVNMRQPYNSSGDDFNLIASNQGRGLFISGRNTKTTMEDVFSFPQIPELYFVSGYIYDGEMLAKPNKTVKLEQEGVLVIEETTDENGYYSFFLEPDQEYDLIGSVDALEVQEKVTTKGKKSPQDLQIDLLMTETGASINGQLFDVSTGEALIAEKVYLYEGLGSECQFVLTNHVGEFEFKNLKPNTQYRIKVDKEGYYTEEKILYTPPQIQSVAKGYDIEFLLNKYSLYIAIYDIYYKYNGAELRQEARAELDKLVDYLKKYPSMKVEIAAHTDNRGSEAYNLWLSKQRAQVALRYLVSKGISSLRLTAKGYGAQDLRIPDAQNEEEHQYNRRANFRISENLSKGTVSEGVIESQIPSVILTEGRKNSKGICDYGVQITASKQRISEHGLFKQIQKGLGLTTFEVKEPDELYHYYVGQFCSKAEAFLLQKQLKELGIESILKKQD